jgi:hypothetical protein
LNAAIKRDGIAVRVFSLGARLSVSLQCSSEAPCKGVIPLQSELVNSTAIVTFTRTVELFIIDTARPSRAAVLVAASNGARTPPLGSDEDARPIRVIADKRSTESTGNVATGGIGGDENSLGVVLVGSSEEFMKLRRSGGRWAHAVQGERDYAGRLWVS